MIDSESRTAKIHTMKIIPTLVSLLALLALSSCKKKEDETTVVVNVAGGLDPHGHADIVTISGGPFYNANAALSIDAWGDGFGSFTAQYGSQFYSGALIYQGNGYIRAEYPSSNESWSTVVGGDQVMLSAGSLGLFVINL